MIGLHTTIKARFSHLSGGDGFPWDEELGVDVVQIPLEGLAFQTFPQSLALADVTKIALNRVNHFRCVACRESYQVVSYPIVVILLVLVQPDLGQADGVSPQHVDAGSPLVGRALAEDVADVRAGNDLESASAHPRLRSSYFFVACQKVDLLP